MEPDDDSLAAELERLNAAWRQFVRSVYEARWDLGIFMVTAWAVVWGVFAWMTWMR
jgi:hypothetical protein